VAQRRHQYERAFESFLRARKIPYVAVNEAKKALLPDRAALKIASTDTAPKTLKSFDFIIYGSSANLLIEIKGRRLGSPAKRPNTKPRLESWVTLDDIESLQTWQTLFGPGYDPVFVFVYQCVCQPPDGLFQEVYEHAGNWYMLRAVHLSDYVEHMRTRSPRWRTVHLPTDIFARISQPFAPSRTGDLVDLGPDLPAFEPLSA
jgi:hypothetical protein